MPELTLESLAARVEVLERTLPGLPPGAIPLKPPYYALPGQGDWESALQAAREIAKSGTYDYEAIREQDACDIQDAEARNAWS